jgi:hypothetical protein
VTVGVLATGVALGLALGLVVGIAVALADGLGLTALDGVLTALEPPPQATDKTTKAQMASAK